MRGEKSYVIIMGAPSILIILPRNCRGGILCTICCGNFSPKRKAVRQKQGINSKCNSHLSKSFRLANF